MRANEISFPQDHLRAVRLLLNAPLVNWVSRYFSYTMDGVAQLDFIEFCYFVLERSEIPDDEYRRYDIYLILAKLSALDRLDRVADYIELFEWALRERRYTLTYSPCGDGSSFTRYLVSQNQKGKRVHFLFLASRRYDVLQKRSGAQRESARRHKQKSDLSDEELDMRYRTLLKELSRFMKGMMADDTK